MSFLELAKERFSCRKFNDRTVEQEKFDKIIKAALLAPTAVNKQPFKIFVVSKENMEKLKKATPFTFGASLALIVCADVKEAYVRGFDNKNFAEIDTAIVATHMMLEIQELGLGTTWVGYFDETVLKSEFPQIEDFSTIAIFPIGYPADDVEVSPTHEMSKSADTVLEVI